MKILFRATLSTVLLCTAGLVGENSDKQNMLKCGIPMPSTPIDLDHKLHKQVLVKLLIDASGKRNNKKAIKVLQRVLELVKQNKSVINSDVYGLTSMRYGGYSAVQEAVSLSEKVCGELVACKWLRNSDKFTKSFKGTNGGAISKFVEWLNG